MLKTYEYSDVNFLHILAVGQHLFEQFAAYYTKPPQKPCSLLKIYTHLNISRKKVHEILKGDKYLGGLVSYKRKLTTPQKKTPVKLQKTESASASTSDQ